MPKGKRTIKRSKLRGRGAYYPGGRVLRGKGGFFDDVGNFFRSAAGPLIGVAGKAAEAIWPGAGQVAQGIRKLVGMGAYTPVRSNSILAQPVPKVGSSQDRGIRYSHQEFLGDVTGSQDWELTQFKVNPGLPESFPWLSGIAGNFQKYRIDGLVFYLRSTSSVAIASSTDLGLGTVLGGYQYNVYDKAPASKLEFLSLSGSLSGKPSEDHIYPMECDRSKNVFGNLLVRTVGVSDDLQKYDHATFNLATVGFPGEYYLGELWVSYNITLMAPKVECVSNTLCNVFSSGLGFAGTQQAVPYGESTVPGECPIMPTDDPNLVSNQVGWSVGFDSGNRKCYLVPAGTSGRFLFAGHMTVPSTTTWDTPVTFRVTALDNSGTVTIDPVSPTSLIAPFSTMNQTPYGTETDLLVNVTLYFVVNIEAKPDKPLLFLPYIVWPTGGGLVTGTTSTWNLVVSRMPDKIFAAEQGSTVSLRQKVARVRRRTVEATASTLATSTLSERKDSGTYVRVDEPTAPALRRQITLATGHYGTTSGSGYSLPPAAVKAGSVH